MKGREATQTNGRGIDFEAVTLIAEKASTRLRTAINRFGQLKELIDTPRSQSTRLEANLKEVINEEVNEEVT